MGKLLATCCLCCLYFGVFAQQTIYEKKCDEVLKRYMGIAFRRAGANNAYIQNIKYDVHSPNFKVDVVTQLILFNKAGALTSEEANALIINLKNYEKLKTAEDFKRDKIASQKYEKEQAKAKTQEKLKEQKERVQDSIKEVNKRLANSDFFKLCNYIKKTFDFWLKRGEFEKKEDYNIRVNEKNARILLELTVKSFLEKRIAVYNIHINASLGKYNVDDEIYPIDFIITPLSSFAEQYVREGFQDDNYYRYSPKYHYSLSVKKGIDSAKDYQEFIDQCNNGDDNIYWRCSEIKFTKDYNFKPSKILLLKDIAFRRGGNILKEVSQLDSLIKLPPRSIKIDEFNLINKDVDSVIISLKDLGFEQDFLKNVNMPLCSYQNEASRAHIFVKLASTNTKIIKVQVPYCWGDEMLGIDKIVFNIGIGINGNIGNNPTIDSTMMTATDFSNPLIEEVEKNLLNLLGELKLDVKNTKDDGYIHHTPGNVIFTKVYDK